MAAAGTIFSVRKFLGPRAEQVFYGMFLIMIAAFYLAFAAYFGIATALLPETAAVVIFAVIGLFGARLPIALIVGYPLHRLWDLPPHLAPHGALSASHPPRLRSLLGGLRRLHRGVCLPAPRRRGRAWTPQPQGEATPPA